MNKSALFLLIISTLVAGCATGSKKESTGSAEHVIKDDKPIKVLEEYGPTAPDPALLMQQQKDLEKSKELDREQDGYLLVLSPGIARSFAHLGVLRVIEEKEINVRAVYGVELGAMIGALWSYGNANKIEWEIFKFKADDFLDKGILGFSRGSSSGKSFSKYLERVLGGRDLVGGSKKLMIGVSKFDGASDGVEIKDNGNAVDAIRASGVYLGLMKPQTLGTINYKSAALTDPIPIETLRKKYNSKTICVDVMGSGDDFSFNTQEDEYLSGMMVPIAAMVRLSTKLCDKVVKVNTYGVHYLNFDAKAELIERGKAAAEKVFNEE